MNMTRNRYTTNVHTPDRIDVAGIRQDPCSRWGSKPPVIDSHPAHETHTSASSTLTNACIHCIDMYINTCHNWQNICPTTQYYELIYCSADLSIAHNLMNETT